MIPSHRGRRLVRAAALSAGLVLLAAACGSASSAPETDGTTTAAPLTRTFSTFNIAMDQGIDSLDPGLSNTTEGWGVMWNVYLPLIGYRHANGAAGATLVPYLAEKLPRVSRDGKTYTIVLRPGVRYSDGTHVRASDFRAAIERDYQLDSVGVGFFDDIVGAREYGETKQGHIAGISVNDSLRKIVIHLVQPEGDFENILATLYAAPVPGKTPVKDESVTPIPATGPYLIRSYEPNRKIVLARNPHFHPAVFRGNVPAGNPDTVRWDLVGSDSAALQRVISGKDDWMSYHAIPANRLVMVRKRYADQLRIFTPANVYYFFMNTKVPPFDNVNVRRAVNYAIDRKALAGILGDLARPTENILPPTYPQYRKHTLYPYDLAKAKKLVRESGDRGMHVTVWNHDLGIDPKFTAYLTDVLDQLGFVATQRIVNSTAYWTTVGNRATQAQIGFANWFQDYPHPQDWFGNLLSGRKTATAFNSNYANYDDPAVDATIGALSRTPTLTRTVDRRWAALDKRVMEDAPWAPFLNREQTDFFSARVDLGCYENNVVYEFDYATICVKQQ